MKDIIDINIKLIIDYNANVCELCIGDKIIVTTDWNNNLTSHQFSMGVIGNILHISNDIEKMSYKKGIRIVYLVEPLSEYKNYKDREDNGMN